MWGGSRKFAGQRPRNGDAARNAASPETCATPGGINSMSAANLATLNGIQNSVIGNAFAAASLRESIIGNRLSAASLRSTVRLSLRAVRMRAISSR